MVELSEAKVVRNPNYLPEGVDPDLAYSKEYVEKHRGEFYYEEPEIEESVVDPDYDYSSHDDTSSLYFFLFMGLFMAGMGFYGFTVYKKAIKDIQQGKH